jgi:hypothetical protein
MKWFLDAFSDGEHTSMSRLLAFLTVFVTILIPGLLWAFLSISARAFVDIPGGFIGFMSAASAITLGMFAANKRAE